MIHDDAKGLQHYVDQLKITLSVLMQCNSDVSFPVLGYLYETKISWLTGRRGPSIRPWHQWTEFCQTSV